MILTGKRGGEIDGAIGGGKGQRRLRTGKGERTVRYAQRKIEGSFAQDASSKQDWGG